MFYFQDIALPHANNAQRNPGNYINGTLHRIHSVRQALISAARWRWWVLGDCGNPLSPIFSTTGMFRRDLHFCGTSRHTLWSPTVRPGSKSLDYSMRARRRFPGIADTYCDARVLISRIRVHSMGWRVRHSRFARPLSCPVRIAERHADKKGAEQIFIRCPVCFLIESLLNTKSKSPLVCDSVKRAAEIELNVHKRRSAKCYKSIKEVEALCPKQEHTEGLDFDLTQNLPLPCIPCRHSVICMYHEGEGRKGANEVCSFVYYYIHTFMSSKVTELFLFSDGATGQNKNHTFVRMCMGLVSSGHQLKTICHRFPDRGQSFLPCDRVFGVIKEKLKEAAELFIEAFFEAESRVLGVHGSSEVNSSSVNSKNIRGGNSSDCECVTIEISEKICAALNSEVSRVIEVSMKQHRNERAGGNGRSPRKPADQWHRPDMPEATSSGLERAVSPNNKTRFACLYLQNVLPVWSRGRSGVAVKPLAFNQGEPGSILGFSRLAGFVGVLPFPPPMLSGAAPSPPLFALADAKGLEPVRPLHAHPVSDGCYIRRLPSCLVYAWLRAATRGARRIRTQAVCPPQNPLLTRPCISNTYESMPEYNLNGLADDAETKPYALDKFEPITNRQEKQDGIPRYLLWPVKTGASANEQLPEARVHKQLCNLAFYQLNPRNFRVFNLTTTPANHARRNESIRFRQHKGNPITSPPCLSRANAEHSSWGRDDVTKLTTEILKYQIATIAVHVYVDGFRTERHLTLSAQFEHSLNLSPSTRYIPAGRTRRGIGKVKEKKGYKEKKQKKFTYHSLLRA
ncbi:hypothetical protein PR048_014608 [Dryococelus australis]|uniref:Uncharacterized protein n=1 Tax=Dryococelus australis TaxID=614101 RepID=A0ABQ9HEP7_9NEOP|nr:hypothetical protein PR048_014608 [Dryococelus australis]